MHCEKTATSTFDMPETMDTDSLNHYTNPHSRLSASPNLWKQGALNILVYPLLIDAIKMGKPWPV